MDAGDADESSGDEGRALPFALDDHRFAEQRVEHAVGAARVVITGQRDAQWRRDVDGGYADPAFTGVCCAGQRQD